MQATDDARLSADEDLTLLSEAAREAGEIAMGYFRRSQEVWWKEGKSPVGEADFAVDRFLKEELLRARPDHGWLSEETVDSVERLSAQRTFVVDPIDGTRAFIDGRDTWCISIAIVEDGRTIAGVLECPAKGETYAAVVGGGAKLNGSPIAVSKPGNEPLIAGPKPMINALPDPLRGRVRTHGYVPSLAYRIAMVASGRLDASFVKPNSHDWDLAAADLVLAEAGGTILDSAGQRPRYAGPDPRHGALAAGSGPLLEVLARVVAAYER